MPFQCYICDYKTEFKCSFINHINRKLKCKRYKNNKYLDEEIKEKHEQQLKKNKNENIEYDEKNNKYVCPICSNIFEYKYNLSKHIKIKHQKDSLINDLQDNKEIFTEIHTNEIINSNNSNDIINSNNTINNINNISNVHNIIINLKDELKPFNDDWCLSNISEDKKNLLLFSKYMYTQLLQEILKNDINKNVIINKDTNSGLIYSINNTEKIYESMDLTSIAEKSMEKLKKHLKILQKEAEEKDFLEPEHLRRAKQIIYKKYDVFNENIEIKKKVECLISNIYQENREESINIMKSIIPVLNLNKGF